MIILRSERKFPLVIQPELQNSFHDSVSWAGEVQCPKIVRPHAYSFLANFHKYPKWLFPQISPTKIFYYFCLQIKTPYYAATFSYRSDYQHFEVPASQCMELACFSPLKNHTCIKIPRKTSFNFTVIKAEMSWK